MSTHRNELTTKAFNFVPTTLKEAQEYATIFASSGLCPEAYRGRPNDILIVWQLGKELGLDKMQALRTLGCINGMPFAYGDGQLALIKRHPDFVDMKEWSEGNIKDGTLTAFCMIKRKNQDAVVREFSMEDAKIAGLWSKKGVWQQYPKRMLQHRARGFCAKDAFPDALYGLMSEDEAQSVADTRRVVEVIQPKNKGMAGVEESLGIIEEAPVVEVISEVEEIKPQVLHEELILNEEVILTSETDIPQIPLVGIDELRALIIKNKVHGTSIKTYLKRCGVKKINELSEEQIANWSNHLKRKENK